MVYEIKKYSWKDGWQPSVSADIVGRVISDIEEKQGSVTNEAFLEASRDKKSPTHSLFEWNDKVAGEKYRLIIANQVIRQLNVEIIREDQEEKVFVPAFINVKEPRSGAEYVNIVEALSNEESKELILTRIRRELHNFIERNKHIEELAEILSEALEELQKVG